MPDPCPALRRLNIFDLIPGSPLDVKGAYNRSFPCIEANYPYAIKNQRGDGSLCVPKPQDARAGSLRNKIAGIATLLDLWSGEAWT